MRRWEYRIVSQYNMGESMVEKANDHGSAGWELTAIDRQDNWVFKRPLEEETLRPPIPRSRPASANKPLENGTHVREPSPAGRRPPRKLS